MSIQKTYSFLNPANYQFNPDLIEVDNGARLKLTDNLNQIFSEDFANDTGFVYDAAKAEFVGGVVQQIDKRPANATFYASFSIGINGAWGNGVLAGTATGGASVSGGKLDLKGNTIQYVDFDADLNNDSQQTGCWRFRYTPNYSGAPTTSQIILRVDESVPAGTNNGLIILHESAGGLRYVIRDSTGAFIVDVSAVWSPTLGQEYEIELNYDITTGANRIFIDGTQLGTTDTNTGIRSSAIGNFRIGSNVDGTNTANFEIRDVLIFSTVQHTTNYTPDWSNIYETIYIGSKIELPQFVYPGIGVLQEYTNLETVEANDPRQVWNDLYYNGSSWVTSNGTFAQANTKAEILANLSTFPVIDTLNVDLIFDDSNTQMNMNAFTATYTGQIYSPGNPSLLILEQTTLEELLGFIATVNKTGSDEIKFILYKDTVPYYHDGVDWVVSDGTYGQSNTYSVIDFYKATFTTERVSMQIEIFFHTGSGGATTPEILDLTVTYDFAGAPDEIHKTVIYGYQKDTDCNPDLTPIKANLNKSSVEYKQTIQVTGDEVQAIPNGNGYWELELTETDNMEPDAFYFFRFKDRLYKKKVPVADFKSFNELTDV